MAQEEEAAAGESLVAPEEDGESKEDAGEKETERALETEGDSPPDARTKLKAGDVVLNLSDTTLNAVPAANGKLLMCLTEGGFQYLLAGARASAGIKSGRYMFEVKIVETLCPMEPAAPAGGRGPMPKQLLRIGFSLKGSSLFLSDGPDNVCFDTEGLFYHDKLRKKASQKFVREQTIAVLLNVDPESPNVNTVSLFRNGARISEPQPLPETLKGKALYPTVTYRNVTLQLNFGPRPLQALPFSCRMLGDAAEADVELAASSAAQETCNVLFPVGLPDAGYFDWVDSFVASNPEYIELSDRKILEWASKSGMWKSKGPGIASNDKPDMRFGLPLMDDQSVRRLIKVVAPTLRRNYIIPELRSNLVPAERKELVASFDGPEFKKVARVIMGPPTDAYKTFVQERLLSDKRMKVELEKKRKAQEEMRKRLFDKRRRLAEEVRKAKEAGVKPAIIDVPLDDEKEEEEEQKADDQDQPVVELTEEEKATIHRKLAAPDLLEPVLAKCYSSFALPSEEEGFDEVTYEWSKEEDCRKLLSDWVLAKKMTQKVEDIKPGIWFAEEWAKWQKLIQEWRRRQAEYKDPSKRKAMLAKRAADARKKKEEEATERGEEYVPPAAEEEEAMDLDPDDIEVDTVDDVNDLGNGEPLYHRFNFEDWMLLSIRFELHLLLHAFRKDLTDEDRTSFGEDHLMFYYTKYFKKQFSLSAFNVTRVADLIEYIKDSVTIEASSALLKTERQEDTPPETFLKFTEDERRYRQRRVEAGDETALLSFSKAPQQPPGRPVAWTPPGTAGTAPRVVPPGPAAGLLRRHIPSAPAPLGGNAKRVVYGNGGVYYGR